LWKFGNGALNFGEFGHLRVKELMPQNFMVYINLYQYLENKVAADKIAQCPYRHTNE
jgi:hypothetical protein